MMARSLLLLCLSSLLACAQPALTFKPIEPVEPTLLQWERTVPLRVAQADGVFVATITRVEEDWTYDSHCGFIAAIFRRCDQPLTVKITTSGQPEQQLWTWTYGDLGLHVGESALFVWHYVYAARIFECQERAGMTSQSCPTDRLPALTDDLDVLPVADSAKVDSLWRSHH